MNKLISNILKPGLPLLFIQALLMSLLFIPTLCLADNRVSAEVDPTSGTVDDVFSLSITIDTSNVSDISNLEISPNNNFDVQTSGQASRHTMINGQVASEKTFTFILTPSDSLKPGNYVGPKGTIDLDGKTVAIDPVAIEIVDQPTTAAVDSKNKTDGVDFVQSVSNLKPYVGQQFLYSANIVTDRTLENPKLSELDLTGFWSESFGDAKETVRSVGNKRTKLFTLKEALFALEPGEFNIPKRQLTAQVQVPSSDRTGRPRRGFDSFFPDLFSFTMYNLKDIRITAPAMPISVRPLPTPPETRQNHIPVGELILSTHIDKETLKQGENLTLTITLSGDANLRPLNLPNASEGDVSSFSIYEDKPELETTPKGDLIRFTKTFKVALIPNKAGMLAVPVYSFLTFNPKINKYITYKTEPRKVEVTENPNFQAAPKVKTVEPVVTTTTAAEKASDTADKALSPLLPYSLAPAKTLSNRLFFTLLAFLAIVGLAVRRFATRLNVHRNDPSLARASNAYRNATAKLESNTTPYSVVLREYLSDKLRYDVLSKTPAELKEELNVKLSPTLAEKTSQMLTELDNLQFSGRAQASDSQSLKSSLDLLLKELEQSFSTKKSFSFFLAFAWLLVLCSALLTPYQARAEDMADLLVKAEQAYQANDFEAAAEAYQKAYSAGINNSSLNYNYATVLAKTNKFGEALFHYRLALAQNPANKEVKANIASLRETLKLPASNISNSLGFFESAIIWPRTWLSDYCLKFTLLILFAISLAIFALSPIVNFKFLTTVGWISSVFFITLFTSFLFSSYDRFGSAVISSILSSTSSAVALKADTKVYSGEEENNTQIIELLSEGTELTVIKISAKRYLVQTPTGREGWIDSENLAVISAG
jgi:tetratricopeptide (TPR) repeat protein